MHKLLSTSLSSYARRMGKGKAFQVLLLGNDLIAQEAEAWNIITTFVSKAEAETHH